MAARPRTRFPSCRWRRRFSPAGASASSTSTTAARPATAGSTATGCAASGASWTWPTPTPPPSAWPPRAKPTGPGSASAAARPAGGPHPRGDHQRTDLTGTKEAVVAAATSYFGVSDLRPFATDTHDFESRYLDGLIGPLPEADDLYAERAPVGHVTGLTCPILLLQGLDDPIVPPSQSEAIAADLAAHGIRHAYIAFPDESHGFRKAETVIAALEAELAFYGEIFGFTPPGVPPIELS